MYLNMAGFTSALIRVTRSAEMPSRQIRYVHLI